MELPILKPNNFEMVWVNRLAGELQWRLMAVQLLKEKIESLNLKWITPNEYDVVSFQLIQLKAQS